MAAFVDAEHALDAKYAQKLGVDLENLLVSQPDNGEQALEIVEVLVRSGGVDVVVVDSVAALVPRAEIEGEMGEAQMGLQARLMSQALRKLTGVVSKSKTCLIFINQLREKIGVMFGNPETTTGGRALVLRVGPRGHPAYCQHQGRRQRHRRPHAREGGEEQGRSAVPWANSTSCKRRHLTRRRPFDPRSTSDRREERTWSPTEGTAWARAVKTRKPSSREPGTFRKIESACARARSRARSGSSRRLDASAHASGTARGHWKADFAAFNGFARITSHRRCAHGGTERCHAQRRSLMESQCSSRCCRWPAAVQVFS
jgi:hypothetical protein